MPRNPKSPGQPAAPKPGKHNPKQNEAVPVARKRATAKSAPAKSSELVILTGLSGSGKASALKAFEDLGYYSVDNLPLELLPRFADLVRQSAEIDRAALVVDIREGQTLEKFPAILQQIKKSLATTVIFLEASDAALLRRYSETRRPHPLARGDTARSGMVRGALESERTLMDPVRNVADITLDTSNFNVHELRAYLQAKFETESTGRNLLISAISFGYKNGVPLEADLVFDVRFLPNPHFIPEFRKLTGRHSKVAAYVRNFPQTREFLDKVTDMLLFLLPYYIQEGKSYLTVAFGCTGGQHRSVAIAEEVKKRLERNGYRAKTAHRDMPRSSR